MQVRSHTMAIQVLDNHNTIHYIYVHSVFLELPITPTEPPLPHTHFVVLEIGGWVQDLIHARPKNFILFYFGLMLARQALYHLSQSAILTSSLLIIRCVKPQAEKRKCCVVHIHIHVTTYKLLSSHGP
jgi:hypothetical protein